MRVRRQFPPEKLSLAKDYVGDFVPQHVKA